MLQFRCSSCTKQYTMNEARIGDIFACSCGQHLKVPRRSGGSAKYRTWGDLFVEMLVYGLGGGLLGFLLGAVLMVPVGGANEYGMAVMLSMGLVGLLLGTLGGERAVSWIGERIRERE